MSFAAVIAAITAFLKALTAVLDWRARSEKAAKEENAKAAQRQFEANEKRIDEEFKS